MTPDTIEQQARREAEERYPDDGREGTPTGWRTVASREVMEQREAYAAALISERSKTQPSVEEVMEVVSLWYADPQRVAPGVTMHDNWKMLRDRLTKLFNK